jgi:hypothetical protein
MRTFAWILIFFGILLAVATWSEVRQDNRAIRVAARKVAQQSDHTYTPRVDYESPAGGWTVAAVVIGVGALLLAIRRPEPPAR